MERLIVIGISVALTFYAAPIIFLMTASFIESPDMGLFGTFLILILGAAETILFFMACMKLGEKLIIKKDKTDLV